MGWSRAWCLGTGGIQGTGAQGRVQAPAAAAPATSHLPAHQARSLFHWRQSMLKGAGAVGLEGLSHTGRGPHHLLPA